MDSPTRPSPMSTTLLMTLTYFPVLLSLLSFYPSLFADHPIYRFFLSLAPFYLAYLSARWYIRLSERSSPLYHPLGCLTQCCVWVFHWAVTFYHAFFVKTYTVKAYLASVFCMAIMFFQEGLFHNIITTGAEDTANLGVYENIRRSYGRGLVIFIRLWYLVDARPQSKSDNARVPTRTRSMTM